MLPGAQDLGGDPARLRLDFERWLAASPHHPQAWQIVQAMGARLDAMPPGIAAPVLGRKHGAARRHVLRGLAIATTTGGAVWLGWRHLPWAQKQARYATGTGERRSVALADGSMLLLDTRSSLDVDYRPHLRRLRLHSGVILVATHADTQVPPRPFVVDTPQGRILALGTRFEVRAEGEATTVTVLAHAVQATLTAQPGMHHHVRAGERLRLTTTGAQGLQPAPAGTGAWAQGQLIATDMPLAQVVAELARYRRGWLTCDPAVAGVRVSGVLPLDDTDQALATLEDGFPVRVVRQWDGWRTRIEPR
jgi:transmembrane sensor